MTEEDRSQHVAPSDNPPVVWTAHSPAQHRLHRSCVVPPRLHRGDELGHQLLPFSLAHVQLLDTPEHLGLETFHVQVRPQGFFGRPHLELCRAEVALKELDNLGKPLACPDGEPDV